MLSVAFSPDGKTLAATGIRGLLFWDLARLGQSGFKPLAFKEGTVSTGFFGPLAFSPAGKTLVAPHRWGDREGGAVLWDVASRTWLTEKPLLISEDYPVSGLAFNRDGTTIATACGGRLGLCDIAHSQRLAELSLGGIESARSVAFSPDGKTLAAGVELEIGACVMLWDVTRRERLAGEPLAVAANDVTSVAFSPDGKTVAAGCGDRAVLWKLARRPALAAQTLTVAGGGVTSVAFSPDSGSLAAGYRRDAGGGAVTCDVQGRSSLADEPLVVAGNVLEVAYSPDGATIAAAYTRPNSGGVALWDAGRRTPHGKILGRPRGFCHGHGVQPGRHDHRRWVWPSRGCRRSGALGRREPHTAAVQAPGNCWKRQRLQFSLQSRRRNARWRVPRNSVRRGFALGHSAIHTARTDHE